MSSAHPSVTTEVAVTLTGSRETTTSGSVQHQVWSAPQRRQRALRMLGILWGIGLFCVILPGIHFVLVPAFFIGGIVTALWIWSTESNILGGTGKCPDCGADFKIEKAADKWPMRDVCDQCHSQVVIDRAEKS